ncbi:hypothetical protein BCR44DRAFT_54401 [Catenaria anguillulae PL171]|uniref:Uncharacterized protein n=1 Tax=Catenaria anguillulae PL171 TaxID=765915 RepID=A0A1Y2HAZ8_9FUNG|nr:hypothetical protein BCR44DRAFT_54401 [Catenaria anguillulae PL171]
MPPKPSSGDQPPSEDDHEAPPYNNRGHPSICFVVEQFRVAASSGRPASALPADADGRDMHRPSQMHEQQQQRVRVRVATCLRKDPTVDRRTWWNLADGVFMTKFTAEDSPPPLPRAAAQRDAPVFSKDQRPPRHETSTLSPTSSPSPWVMDQRGEVHLGDQMANLPQGVATSIQTTFQFPLAVSLAYLHGFTNGTHADLVHRTAMYYSSDAPWRSIQRAMDLWVGVWRNATSGSTSA